MEIEINLYNLTNINTEGKQTVNNTKKKRNKIEKNGTITKTVVELISQDHLESLFLLGRLWRE